MEPALTACPELVEGVVRALATALVAVALALAGGAFVFAAGGFAARGFGAAFFAAVAFVLGFALALRFFAVVFFCAMMLSYYLVLS
jgi:hypothetical protein